MKKKMEVASPFHLHTMINDQISQKDHGYVTPMTNKNIINVLLDRVNLEKNLMQITERLSIVFYEKTQLLEKNRRKEI